jgi:hypothetical protein
MGICKNCIHFKKETVAFPELDTTYDTWINFANPAIEGAPAYDIAQCDNSKTKPKDISRHESTAYFFNDKKYTDTFNGMTVAGENDSCPNFEPIP